MRRGVFIGSSLVLLLASAFFVRTAARSQDAEAPTYVGSAACRMCHRVVVNRIAGTPHEALALDDEAGPNRGCEGCHGPGGDHVGDPTNMKPQKLSGLEPAEAVKVCGACHFSSRKEGVAPTAPTVDERSWYCFKHYGSGVVCSQCHSIHSKDTDAELRKVALVAEGQALCEMCHGDKKAGENVHFPVAQGGCLDCHDPHGGPQRDGLSGDVRQMCEMCHQPSDEAIKGAHQGYDIAGTDCLRCHLSHSRDVEAHRLKADQHFPFAQRQCGMCHKSADESPKPVLNAEQQDLCYACHKKNDLMPKNAKVVHLPMEMGKCTLCHEPHASTVEHRLRRDERGVCGTCHPHEELRTITAAYGHPPATEGKCSTCHNPHGTKDRKLLMGETDQSCSLGDCHETTPHAMHKTGKQLTVPLTNKVVDVYCTSCHNPHGGRHELLSELGLDMAECVKCHEQVTRG